jgi:hypothetical protein
VREAVLSSFVDGLAPKVVNMQASGNQFSDVAMLFSTLMHTSCHYATAEFHFSLEDNILFW